MAVVLGRDVDLHTVASALAVAEASASFGSSGIVHLLTAFHVFVVVVVFVFVLVSSFAKAADVTTVMEITNRQALTI